MPPSEWIRLRGFDLIETGLEIQALKQPEIAQFAAQRLGHRGNAGAHGTQIRRDIAVGEIAPALERPHRALHHRDHLGLHHQPAAPDTVAIPERFDRDDFFAGRDFTPDHPVKRTAREQLLAAFRYHPGDVNMMPRQALLLRGFHAFCDPALEIPDGLAADGKLDEM
jgi:hypothetical protein